MLARIAIVVVLSATGCWTRSAAPGPVSWRRSTVVEVLPEGAWLVAALDLELDSPAQRANEAKARKDPRAVRNPKGGCQFPSTHFAVAMYEGNGVVVASRGGYHRTALLDCVADIAIAGERGVHRGTIGGLPSVEVRAPDGGFAFTATDHGMVVGASSVPLLARTVDARTTALADARLGPLVRDARSRGELWVAARVPASGEVVSVLRMLGIDSSVRITSIVGAIRLTAPRRIDVVLEVAGDAATLATALETRRRALGLLVDAELTPIIDAVRVTAEGSTVRIVGAPPSFDVWKVFQGVLRTMSAFTTT